MPRRRRFPNDRTSPGEARRFVLDALTPEVTDGFVDTAILLTSELVTNALLHARSGMEVVVEITPGIVRVEVLDDSAALPARKHYGPQTTTGRGLLLLDRLATSWGAEPTSYGKRVWFEIDRTSPRPEVTDESGSLSAPATADEVDLDALAAWLGEDLADASDDADGTGEAGAPSARAAGPRRSSRRGPRSLSRGAAVVRRMGARHIGERRDG